MLAMNLSTGLKLGIKQLLVVLKDSSRGRGTMQLFKEVSLTPKRVQPCTTSESVVPKIKERLPKVTFIALLPLAMH